jgi:Leucine-rich repeat (LRR) protein
MNAIKTKISCKEDLFLNGKKLFKLRGNDSYGNLWRLLIDKNIVEESRESVRVILEEMLGTEFQRIQHTEKVLRRPYLGGSKLFPSEEQSVLKFLRSVKEKYPEIVLDENAIKWRKFILKGLKRGRDYSSLWKELQTLNGLIYYLDISNNFLPKVPSEIGKFQKLKYLDLSSNELTEIFPEIENLNDLEYCDVSLNKIIKFPETIETLEKLAFLDFSWNNLQEVFVGRKKQKSLRYLDLSGNKLEGIPPEIGNLMGLKYLNLSSNKLKEFPFDLTRLTNLKSLNLSVNEIPDFQIDIKKRLENLRYFNIRWNDSVRSYCNEVYAKTRISSDKTFIERYVLSASPNSVYFNNYNCNYGKINTTLEFKPGFNTMFIPITDNNRSYPIKISGLEISFNITPINALPDNILPKTEKE